ncbi:MAG: hypothetical protein FWD57_04565, partial [Polyangiaceae bacterium]|nr:hypothetical protein [Polyangiaceae bacterium]
MKPKPDSTRNQKGNRDTTLGDSVVDSLFVFARDISRSRLMRQLPLFREEDDEWLSTVRSGLVTVVLRIVTILFAESKGILPLGNQDYDSTLALTPRSADNHSEATWQRFVRVSRVLSGEKSPPPSLSIEPWHSAVFESSSLGPIGVIAVDDLESLRISDAAIRAVIQILLPALHNNTNVDQIASVYERLVSFELVRCYGRSIQWKQSRAIVDVDKLADLPPENRSQYLEELGLRPSQSVLDNLLAASDYAQTLKALSNCKKKGILPVGTAVFRPATARRRAAAQYSAQEVVKSLVKNALDPLIPPEPVEIEQILSLRICDPAMGTGAFLIEACHHLANHIVAHSNPDNPQTETALQEARNAVATSCLYGVDIDPLAAEYAQLCLALVAIGPDGAIPDLSANLKHGDAIIGVGPWKTVVKKGGVQLDEQESKLQSLSWVPGAEAIIRGYANSRAERSQTRRPKVEGLRRTADAFVNSLLAGARPKTKKAKQGCCEPLLVRDSCKSVKKQVLFHWPLEFPEVLSDAVGGFDAFIGNPPWMAYTGRWAHPLRDAIWNHYLNISDAFGGHRSLHSLFIHRCASMLKPGGRLGLVVPTSMSDMPGYLAVRRVHHSLCEVDESLPEYGGRVFDGVVQPAMGLLSTRRLEDVDPKSAAPWPVCREDLGGVR